ncbi:MAG: helix-turn-helix transcriptional regulator [Coriobacteriaceae bacterium]|nr:helix-turn-helix transcriptional regulator [Coriobacteriaceae bacterium]
MEQRLFGDILRNERKRMGLSLSQAAERLRIRPDILQAIENSDIPNMPPHGYARNMVMGYAKFVGLDPSVLAAMYNDEYERFESGHDRIADDRPAAPRRREAVREPRAARRAREAREGRAPAGGHDGDPTQRMNAPLGAPVDYRERTATQRIRPLDSEDRPYRRTRFDDDYDLQPQTVAEEDYGYEDEERSPLSSVSGALSGFASRVREGSEGLLANRNAKLGIIAGALVLVLVIILAFGFGCGKKDNADSTKDTSTQQTTQTAKETPKAPTSMKVEYKVDEGTTAWVEVYVDGEQKLAEEVKGEKKDSFEVTGNLEFVAATTDGVHVYIDGEEQELETNANGLVDMTFSFADYLSEWEKENGVKSSSSSNGSSNSTSSDSSSSSSESTSDSADTQADTSSIADTAVDAGTDLAESEAPAADQGSYTYDAGTVDNGAGYTDEASGSATTDGL